MISGIPSPWARVLMTRKALAQNPADLGDSVLDMCYKMFRSEWRGLVAAYALRPDSFEFSAPIPLLGNTLAENFGEMSVLNMYGEMLFEETPLWTLKSEKVTRENLRSNPPCLQILYYKIKNDGGFKKIAVGATSPYSLLFSSINYRLPESQETDIPWLVAGKFVDPTDLSLDKFKVEDAQRLHSFIHNMASRMHSGGEGAVRNPSACYMDYFMNFFQSGCVTEDYNIGMDFMVRAVAEWNAELTRWKMELEKRIAREGRAVNTSIPVAVAMPAGPLAMLMNNERTFWYESYKLYSDAKDGPSIKSSEIFMDSEYIAAWRKSDDALRDHSKLAVYYLHATHSKTGAQYWLPLPFTKKATEFFAHDIAGIMLGKGAVKLTAQVGEDGKVEIDFKAQLDDSVDYMSICKKTYQMEVIPETDGKVFVWPDFKSPQWKKYFYYSEFPTNVTGVRMIPRFEGVDESQLADMRIVTYPVNKVGSAMHKYEILASATPLSAVEIRLHKGGQDITAGTLVLKQDKKKDEFETGGKMVEGTQYLKDFGVQDLAAATLGIDFGSTNTCAYYKAESSSQTKPIPFTNRRLAVVGFDNPKRSLAQKDELLFISNEETSSPNGQVKSWLHEHDSLYVTTDGIRNHAKPHALVRGVPVNESNIAIESMNETEMMTNAGKLYYNMKWLSGPEDIKNKTSYMQMLWFHICADMMAVGLYPKIMNWSFPTSMTSDKLKLIYDGATVSPYGASVPCLAKDLSETDYTEAEAAAVYANDKVTLDGRKLLLGVDIGGSTSDMFISNKAKQLLTQSSVRLAGGFFFKAINSSARFRRALYDFHESGNTGVKVLNIADVKSTDPAIYKRSPYYLNNIFDQLHTDEDFKQFYLSMRTDVPVVFALPAYVTGVLLYYSGMLVKNVIDKQGYSDIDEVEMKYYGKGGRLFEWLYDMYGKRAVNYYSKCFAAGVGTTDVKFNYNVSDKTENKSEVAIGLASGKLVTLADSIKRDENGTRIIDNYDIIGEKNISFVGKDGSITPLNEFDVMSKELFQNGMNIEFPRKLEKFNEFLDIFFRFIEIDSGGIMENMSDLTEGRDKIRVSSMIENDPEYLKALEEKKPYKMPVIIAAALSYLNDTLIPAVAKELQ